MKVIEDLVAKLIEPGWRCAAIGEVLPSDRVYQGWPVAPPESMVHLKYGIGVMGNLVIPSQGQLLVLTVTVTVSGVLAMQGWG